MSGRAACIALALIAGVPGMVPAGDDAREQDDVRAAWRYRREVQLTGSDVYAAIRVPPEMTTHATSGLVDVRLVAADGTEVPYVVDRLSELDASTSWPARLIDTRRERRRETQWTVDLDEPRRFDSIDLNIAEQDFAKRLRIEYSDGAGAWHVAREDAGVFDRMWGERIHHTRIELSVPITARVLRLTADDRRSSPVALSGVSVSATRRRQPASWVRSAQVLLLRTEGGVSRYRLDLPLAVPFETLKLEAEDPAFCRRVVLFEARDVNGRRAERPLAQGQVYRLTLPGEDVACEALELTSAAQTGGQLLLDVHDMDSPPLRRVRVSISGVEQRIVFPAIEGHLTAYYGNPRARAPLYDIASLGERLRRHLAARRPEATALVGEEIENPRFRLAPPLPFVATQGAALTMSEWRSLRPLSVDAGEDLYTLTLAASDLASLRPDLADLRLADASGRQVPFILEADAAREQVALTVERLSAASARDSRAARVSRYALRLPIADSGQRMTSPLRALRLTFADWFFQRRARLTTAGRPAAYGGRPETLFVGELARHPDVAAPVNIELGDPSADELTLEIDEGDNAPLTLTAAQAVVSVPRIVFKARSGSYRVLLGNARADAPRYDLATLRREVLCYSARTAKAGPTEANPAFRRGVFEYFRAAPPTVLLWGVLLLAVAALVFLTVRIVRGEPKDGKDAMGT